jgi:hypothetical protein
MVNRPYPANETRAAKPFDLMHSDLKSYPIASVHNHTYIMVIIDDHTSYAWMKLLKHKDDSVKALRQFLAMVKTQYNVKIKRWRSDQGH